MTLTPSVRAISLCSFPCVANSSACANFVAISSLECLFLLGISACPIRPPPYVVPQISFCALGAAQRVPSPINGNQLSLQIYEGLRPLCGAQLWTVRPVMEKSGMWSKRPTRGGNVDGAKKKPGGGRDRTKGRDVKREVIGGGGDN